MQSKNVVTFLTSVLIITAVNAIFSNENVLFPSLGNAYAQTSPGSGAPGDTGAPGSVAPGDTGAPGDLGAPGDVGAAGDNSTGVGGIPSTPGDVGAPGDNSTGTGGIPGAPGNPSVPGNVVAPGDIGAAADNSTGLGTGNVTSAQPQTSTASATTPEFGPMASVILILAIVSILVISARTRLRF